MGRTEILALGMISSVEKMLVDQDTAVMDCHS